MRKLQSFEILKLSSSRLKDSNYSISGTLYDFRKSHEIVRLGDNQMLRSLRRLKNIEFSQEELDDLLFQKKKLKYKIDSLLNQTRLSEIEKRIDEILFVEEIISIKFDNVTHYNKVARDGIYINGSKFVRFISSAGSLRRSTVFFAREDVADKLIEILDNDRNKEYKLVPSKMLAYRGLMTSGTLEVSFPKNFVVIPDMEVSKKIVMDYVSNHGQKIEEKLVDYLDNCFDGQGLVDNDQAEIWARELEVDDYIPSWFVFRSSWLKGQLVTFPIKEYAKKYNQNKIVDVWGNEHDLNNVAVIFSASQFKLWQAYKSADDYMSSCRKNHIGFGITRCAKEKEKEHSYLNYQFLQTLLLNEKSIEELCEPAVNWLNSTILNLDNSSLIYLLGESNYDNIKDFWEQSNDIIAKALLINPNIIRDKFVREKIIRSLNGKIKESYLGVLPIRGSYFSIMADPFAQMQWATLRDPNKVDGLLKTENEHYCRIWSDRKVETVASLRAPLTVGSEVNVLKLKDDKETQYWYRFIGSGLIYNIFSDSSPRQSGKDYDGDIVLVVDSPAIINNIRKGNAIGKESLSGTKVIVNKELEMVSESNSLGQRVGNITNVNSSLWSLLCEFPEDSDEYKEIYRRILLCRFYQESEIDFAKTGIREELPSHWTKLIKITDDMDEETKRDALFNNKICIVQRPLFMVNLYNKYQRRFNREWNKYNNYCIHMWGVPFEEILLNGGNTEEQNKLIDYYKYRSFFLSGNSVMNNVYRYMKSKVKKIKINSKQYTFDYKKLMSASISLDPEKIKKMNRLLSKYKGFSKTKKENFNEYNDVSLKMTKEDLYYSLRKEAIDISSDERELASLAVYITYNGNKNYCSFAWNVFGDGIIQNLIENNESWRVNLPVKDSNGEIEYLFDKYNMKEFYIYDIL